MARKNILLGDFLVEQGIITEEQLREALKYHHEKGVRLGRSLIDLGFITEQDMIKALSEQLGVQYVKLKTYRVDPEVIDLISAETAWNYLVVPLFKIRERLIVAMVNPLDIFAIDALTRATRMKIEPVVCSETEIREALETYYPVRKPAAEKPEPTAVRPAGDHNALPQNGFLAELEDFLHRLADKQAHLAFITAEKIRVNFGEGHADWPLPDKLDHKSFIRMLCNLGQEAIPHERSPHRFVIEKQYQGMPLRFHVVTGTGAMSETAAVMIQMPRELLNGKADPESEYVKLKESLPRTRGIVIIGAPRLHLLDRIYYSLWEEAARHFEYPISVENQPTTLVSGTAQLPASHPAEQLALLRYAQTINADCLFLKNITDPVVMAHVLHLAELGTTIVTGVITRTLWNVHEALVDGSQHEKIYNYVRYIYTLPVFAGLCPSCKEQVRPSKKLLERLGSRAPGEIYRSKGCEMCRTPGSARPIEVEIALRIDPRDGGEQNEGGIPATTLSRKLKNRYRKTLLHLLEQGAIGIEEAAEFLQV